MNCENCTPNMSFDGDYYGFKFSNDYIYLFVAHDRPMYPIGENNYFLMPKVRLTFWQIELNKAFCLTKTA